MYSGMLQQGAIRVYCRIRPQSSKEAGQEVAVNRVDAFQLEVDTATWLFLWPTFYICYRFSFRCNTYIIHMAACHLRG